MVVDGPQTRHRQGELFKIDIRIAMPEHHDVIVTRTHGDAPEREHALVAIREAFDAAVRQIEDVARDMRGQVKEHVGGEPWPGDEIPRRGRLRLHRNGGRP